MDRPVPPSSKSDRERLKEVKQTDLTESRVNEEFVEWLKTKGPTWLLIVMVALTAYLGMVRWRESRAVQHNTAWAEFAEAQTAGLPSRFEIVAEQYGKIDSIGVFARLHAAQQLLMAVQRGKEVGAEIGDVDAALTPEDREQYLTRADRAYQDVLAKDDGSQGMTIHAAAALNGRAAVAEARGEHEAARRLYLDAAKRAEVMYPALAEQARKRAETVDEIRPVTLASANATLPGPGVSPDRKPATIEPALRDLLLPQ